MLVRSLSLSHGYETLRLRRNRPAKNRLSKIIKSCAPRRDLRGQSVAIIGLGKSGRAAARLALARGASVLAIDENKNLGLLEQDPLFEEYSGLRTILGNLDVQLLKDVDLVVVSPGFPPENYGLSILLESGQQIMSELDFAAEILPKDIKILAVTGTNGKSTVVTFAGQMLTHFGIEAFVGGNLGNPLSEAAFLCLTPSMKPRFQVAVVEVSSYQMEIPNNYFCPSVAAVLNLTPDHLERHKTMKNYAMTKCSLLSHMTDTKLGLLCFGNQHLNEAVREHAEKFNLAWIGAFPGVKINSETKIASLEVPTMGVVSQLQLDAMKVMGTHNYYNAAAAALCVLGLDLGLDANGMSSTIENLRAPPHRMEIVHRDANGVIWVDDSKATNVEATYTGLLGLKQQKSVILLGGLAKCIHMKPDVLAACLHVLSIHHVAKGLVVQLAPQYFQEMFKVVYGKETNGFEQLIDPLKYHRCVITFGSSGKMIQKTLSDNGLSIPCIGAKNMEDAVNCARGMAKFGDAIVLSPGCASFDEFRNFEHRGLVFQEMAFSS